MHHRSCAVLSLFAWFICSCTADAESDASLVIQRDTLPNGAVHISYSGLPEGRIPTASPDLWLGAVEGDPNLVFGDVRGVDADGEGKIFVLDHLASEIRAFDASGAFLHRVAGKGEGPGEIGQANGLKLVGDTILWVQDHGKWMMLGLTPDGEELARVPMPVRRYGYVWDGTVDLAGRIWKPDYISDQERTDIREEGLNEITGRVLYRFLDPSTGAVDSVFLGFFSDRWMVTAVGNGWLNSGIPFDAKQLTAVDPDGGFWQVNTPTYRIVRFDEAGDTTLVLEADTDPISVNAGDRADYIERSASRGQRFRQIAEEVAELMPETKPQIQKLVVDDEGRLWVERTVREGANPVFDVFNRDGTFQGSTELTFRPHRLQPIRISHGHIYAVVLDEWDVPSIVRAEVPEEFRGPEVG